MTNAEKEPLDSRGKMRAAPPASEPKGLVCNILIVDDEPSNLLALEAILEPLGQPLIRAASGTEALKLALRHDFCAILLDVQMPDMDGFETAELLRKRPRTRDVPIIFLTAISKDRQFISRGYDVGAVDYLFKPYDPDILRSKVSVFVELSRKNQIIAHQSEAIRQMSERELADFKRWSERRYSDLGDAIPQIVWTADARGELVYQNRRWHDIAGTARDFGALVHPDELPRFDEGWTKALGSGSAWEAVFRLGNARVGYRSHLVSAVPRREDDGTVVGWVGTGMDIDAHMRAQRALQMLADASRRLGRSLEEPREIEAVLRGALPVLGSAARLDIHANGHPRERLVATDGAVDAKVLDDPRFDLGPATVGYSRRAEIHLDVRREREEADSRQGADSGGRWENQRFLDELGVSAYMCLPLVSRDRAVGTVTFVRLDGGTYDRADQELADDLARRVAVAIDNARLHETTERRREELEQANKSKDVFLATLSHELRTPLNAIVGWTDMMRGGLMAEDELARAIDTIDRNAHALNGLVADLLDVSRIVTGSLKLDSKLVGLVSVVEAAVEAARPQCVAKNVKLDIALGEMGCVKGDFGRLRQVVGNLLSNAVKFTPENGTVAVRLTADGETARIVVEDSGEGIAADFLPHVFERFRQAETARARGLGLGLAIVKHLVEEHGGTVRAESEGRGKGARFTVALPLATEPVSGLEEYDGRVPQAHGEPALGGVHVLIVEDDPDGNELIRTILERYGARVTAAMTAADALAALEEERPDVLVSDIGLPDKDGIELIKSIRSSFGTSLPAVALTAYASRQDATRAIAAGFDAHVAKPVQPSTLGAVVARLTGRDAASDATPPGVTPAPPQAKQS